MHRASVADGSFDLVVAFEVIEHLEDWREFLQRSAPGACAGRTVYRFDSQQALLCGIARARPQSVSRARIRV